MTNTNNIINEAIAIQSEINRLTEKLDTIKNQLRADANGQGAKWITDTGYVTVSKPTADSTVLDSAAWKKAAPKLYTETLEKYHKTRHGNAGAVTVTVVKS